MPTLGATGGCPRAPGRPARELMGCRVYDPVARPTTGATARSRERQGTIGCDVPRGAQLGVQRLRRHDYVWRGPRAGVDRRLEAAPWTGPDRAQAAGMLAGQHPSVHDDIGKPARVRSDAVGSFVEHGRATRSRDACASGRLGAVSGDTPVSQFTRLAKDDACAKGRYDGRLDQPVSHGEECRDGPVRSADLGVDVLDMVVCGFR